MASQVYPWYEIVGGAAIEQGDLLAHCPVITPIRDLTWPLPKGDVPGVIQYLDLIVMTQSCDLTNDKVRDVILCAHVDLNAAGQIETPLAKRDAQQSILKGYRPRYAMLAASEIQDMSMNVRILDFGRVFSLPKSFTCQFAAQNGKRLRLCPPYREHVSQAFARFFMRVGLPQDIALR